MKHSSQSNGHSESKAVAYAEWVIRWRWPVVILSLFAAVFLASGGRFLKFDTDYRVFFSKDNPQLQSFEDLQNIYTKNDNILFVVEPEGGDVFQSKVLDVIEKLTDEGWRVPYSIRVDAITNYQHTRAYEDDLLVGDLVSESLKRSQEELEEARQIALDQPVLFNRLISEKTHVTGVNVTLQLPGKDINEVPNAVEYARKLAAKIEIENPGIKIYLTGIVMLNNAFSEAGINDMQSLVPLMYLFMFIIMVWLLRSFSSTFATIMVISLSTGIAMGLTGWFGVGLTPPSSQAMTMIMTLAVADSIHILVALLNEMRKGQSKWNAIVESLRVNIQPVFLTSLTTAIGFLSMNVSDAPPLRHLGNITATGVTAAFIYSILFLPALMAILPVWTKPRAEKKASSLDGIANFVIGRRRPLLWGISALVLFLGVFVQRNELNDQFVGYFGENIQFRQDTDFTMDNLTGLYQIEYSLGAGESGGISNPEYLTNLEAFAEWYRSQPNVVNVNAFSEVMKRLNKSMHGDDPSWYRLPNSRELAAQYLLLYEFSLPYGLDLNNQINVDKSATRFSVTLADMSSREMREIGDRGDNWLKENVPDYMFTNGSSAALMFSHISGRNIISMLKGTTLAIILISIALIIALRSFKFGALSIVPNLVPAVMGFGLWGIIAGEINMALSMVSGMTLGIVVDDTIHFLSKYLRARREMNLNPEDAVRYTFSSVGKALIVTTVILMVGFAILSFSDFQMNSGMGQLTAITIAFALLADFFFLPPILMKLDEKKYKKQIG